LVREAGKDDLHVGLLGWHGSTPAEKVPGFVFSDRFYGYLDELGRVSEDPSADCPATLYWDKILPKLDLSSILKSSLNTVKEYSGPYRDDVRGMRKVDRDRFYASLAPALLKEIRPRLTLLSFEGGDSLGHYFWPYWEPEYYPGSYRKELPKYRDVLPGYYQYLDKTLGELVATVGPQTTIFLISPYGMEPFVGGGRMKRAGHGNGPAGILVASGENIKQGAGWLSNASILDIAPTILYLLGLPISEELEGRVLMEIIAESFQTEHPVRRVPSYGPRLPETAERTRGIRTACLQAYS